MAKSGTLDMMMSAHQPIFVIKKKSREKREEAHFVGRSYEDFDIHSFKEGLCALDLDDIFEIDDPEEIWGNILGHIKDDLDMHCPIREFNIRNYKPEWVTPALLEQIRDRDYFYKKAKQNKSEDDWNIAKHLRNLANRNITKAKADFVINKLNRYKGDGGKFWKEILKVFPSKKNGSHTKIVLRDENGTVEEESRADFINTFFINVGNVAGGINARILGSGSGVGDALLGLDGETEEVEEVNETLMEVRESEVYNVTKTAKSPGIKDMNGVVVKEAFKVSTGPLTHLYNISLKKGIFPDSWKIAMVVPIPKGGDPSQVSNLRPISLLPQPGKVLEKLVI